MSSAHVQPGRAPDTRRMLLRELLHHKPEGLTLDELGGRLGISRNAAQQHVRGLERDGLVAVVGQRETAGRPIRLFGLTERGLEAFPRRYELLAQGMLETVRRSLGEGALDDLLARMADEVAGEEEELSALPPQERTRAVAAIMNELGYDARVTADGAGVEAVNCIYHKLASRTRAVCRYDERLLSRLLGRDVRLHECMADGRRACVFRPEGTSGG